MDKHIVRLLLAFALSMAAISKSVVTGFALFAFSVAALVWADLRVLAQPYKRGFMHLARSEVGAAEMNRIMGIIFAVILVVIGIVLAPLVIDQTAAVIQSGLTDFPGLEAIVGLIPLLYAVGILGLAGFVATRSLRS